MATATPIERTMKGRWNTTLEPRYTSFDSDSHISLKIPLHSQSGSLGFPLKRSPLRKHPTIIFFVEAPCRGGHWSD